jgi:hypothetical protein
LNLFRPSRGSLTLYLALSTRLTSWATICRPYGASSLCHHATSRLAPFITRLLRFDCILSLTFLLRSARLKSRLYFAFPQSRYLVCSLIRLCLKLIVSPSGNRLKRQRTFSSTLHTCSRVSSSSSSLDTVQSNLYLYVFIFTQPRPDALFLDHHHTSLILKENK